MSSGDNISGGKHDYGGVQGSVNNNYGPQNYYPTAPPGKLFAGVPPRPTLFVGRAALLDQLVDDLQQGAAAVTTHGVGGMGKTALATMLVYNRALLDHFSDGVLWASLGPNPDLVGILNSWGDALGQPVREVVEVADKVQHLQRAMAQRTLLVVLDDVWHKDVAGQLRKVTGSGCAFLLTSRDYLIAHQFAPAACRNVAELDPAAAVDLLATLCPITARRRDLLGELAAAVGNHPLALQLVGGYLDAKIVRASQAALVIAALRQSRAWLTLRVDDRDANLDQILALSLDALPDETSRTAFLRLAAFAPKTASFSFDAAQAVAACDEDTLTLLLHRHLLEQPPNNLERLSLHQTLHTLASDRCRDLSAARRAHAEFYLKLMQDNNKDTDWPTIEAAWEQIKHAWGWVSGNAEELVKPYISATQTFQTMRGYWRERMEWCNIGLEVARKVENKSDEAWILVNLGWVYSAIGEQEQALRYFEQALPIRRQVGDRAGEAATLHNIGLVYSAIGEQEQALRYYEQALPILRQVGDRSGEASTLTNIGSVYSAIGEQEQALRYFEQALPILRQVGHRSGEASTLNNIGSVYSAIGEQQQALRYYEQALPILRQVGDRAGEAATLTNIGSVYSAIGEQQQALRYFEQALPIWRQVGDRSGEANTLNNIGAVYSAIGEKQQALRYFEQALPIKRQVGHRSGEATTLNNIGAVYSALGDKPLALDYYQQALPIMRQVGDRAGEAVTRYNIAMIYVNRGDYAAAVTELEQVVALDEAVQHPDLASDLAKLEEVRRMGQQARPQPPRGGPAVKKDDKPPWKG